MPISDETSQWRLGDIEQQISSCSAINATPSWYLANSRYIVRNGNHLTPYFSGKAGFAAVAESIKNAQKSVDIVTMGFDPAIPLIRGDGVYQENHNYTEHRRIRSNVEHVCSQWRREDAYGEILLQALRDHPELKIRIVLWYANGGIGSSVIGIGSNKSQSEIKRTELATGFDPQAYGGRDGLRNLPLRERYPAAADYSAQWFYDLRWKNFPEADRIAVAFRDISNHAITEEDPRVGAESGSLSWPADHQKVILVDYDNVKEDPLSCHAYILGLNAQTEYWSDFPFVHRDPRNEMDNRPWHDFAVRVQGPLVIDLNHNFCEAWGRERVRLLGVTDTKANTSGYRGPAPTRALERESAADLIKKRKELEPLILAAPRQGTSSGQIVRTRPDRTAPNGSPEKEIKDAYLQATRHARNYILVVNQYCQYAKLIRHIKYWRSQAKDCGLNSKLYVLMGTCKPERGGMVFRSQQMANELGVGIQFPVADREMYYQGEDDERRVSEGRTEAVLSDPYGYEDRNKIDELYDSANADQYRRANNRTRSGETLDASEEKLSIEDMKALGIYPLFFMFYTQIPETPRQVGGKALREDTLAQQVYVHAKLMVEDDIFFTLGSANLNIRSQAVDSELNIISDDIDTAQQFREELFRVYAGEPKARTNFPNYQRETIGQNDMDFIYNRLKRLTSENYEVIKEGKEPITGYISKFEDNRSVTAFSNVRIG